MYRRRKKVIQKGVLCISGDEEGSFVSGTEPEQRPLPQKGVSRFTGLRPVETIWVRDILTLPLPQFSKPHQILKHLPT